MTPSQVFTFAILADIIVTAAVVLWVMKRNGLFGSGAMSLAKLRNFSDTIGPLTRDYLQANYGGNPDTLPDVLADLLAQIEQQAKEQQLELSRDTLKMVMMRTIAASQHELTARAAMTALKKVA